MDGSWQAVTLNSWDFYCQLQNFLEVYVWKNTERFAAERFVLAYASSVWHPLQRRAKFVKGSQFLYRFSTPEQCFLPEHRKLECTHEMKAPHILHLHTTFSLDLSRHQAASSCCGQAQCLTSMDTRLQLVHVFVDHGKNCGSECKTIECCNYTNFFWCIHPYAHTHTASQKT